MELSASTESFLNLSNPVVETVLAGGQRASLFCPPLTQGYAFVIRKPMRRLLPFATFGINDADAARLRQAIVGQKKNIVLAGQTGSGKTALASSLIDCIPDEERIVTIEDVPEIFLRDEKNVERFLATKDIHYRELVRSALRSDPDRILIGEVRGPEAYDLLTSWNTGHPGGITTLHANSAADAITRLKTLVFQSKLRLPDDFFQVIDVVIFLGDRRMKEVIGL